MIGLEQEFFLVPRAAYLKRMDLQLAGRTVMGAFPARGQELCDHYMSALNIAALECMREMQACALHMCMRRLHMCMHILHMCMHRLHMCMHMRMHVCHARAHAHARCLTLQHEG